MRKDRMKCDRCGEEYSSNRIVPLGRPKRMYSFLMYLLPTNFEKLGVPYYICENCRSDFMDFMDEIHRRRREESARHKEHEQRGGGRK